MFKALYNHVNNIIEKYLKNLRPYPNIFTMDKKGKIETKTTIKPYS